jgi:hypothetical protein
MSAQSCRIKTKSIKSTCKRGIGAKAVRLTPNRPAFLLTQTDQGRYRQELDSDVCHHGARKRVATRTGIQPESGRTGYKKAELSLPADCEGLPSGVVPRLSSTFSILESSDG